MTLRKKMALPLAAACMVLGLMVVAQSATATHPRPLGASPYRAALVVAYKQCGVDLAPNSTHKPPLAVPSCAGDPANNGNPAGIGPAQISDNLTTGNQTAFWGAANMTGDVTLVATGTDVSIKSTITDVRCRPGSPVSATTKCGAPNGVDGAGGANCTGPSCVPGTSGTLTPPDYGGEIQGTTEIQITDHGNTGPAFTTPGTMVRIPFPVTGTCVFTSATNIGGTCSVNTTANAVCGCVFPGDRGNVEFTQPIVINDGGADGVVSTADNKIFLRNGILIP